MLTSRPSRVFTASTSPFSEVMVPRTRTGACASALQVISASKVNARVFMGSPWLFAAGRRTPLFSAAFHAQSIPAAEEDRGPALHLDAGEAAPQAPHRLVGPEPPGR